MTFSPLSLHPVLPLWNNFRHMTKSSYSPNYKIVASLSPLWKSETANILKVREVTSVLGVFLSLFISFFLSFFLFFSSSFQLSWLQLYRGLMSHYNSRRVWLTILHDSPSKKLICVGNSEMPSRHSVSWLFLHFFLEIVRIIVILLSPWEKTSRRHQSSISCLIFQQVSHLIWEL